MFKYNNLELHVFKMCFKTLVGGYQHCQLLSYKYSTYMSYHQLPTAHSIYRHDSLYAM